MLIRLWRSNPSLWSTVRTFILLNDTTSWAATRTFLLVNVPTFASLKDFPYNGGVEKSYRRVWRRQDGWQGSVRIAQNLMDSYSLLVVSIAIVAVVANTFFAVGEFTAVHLSQSQIRERAANGNPLAKKLVDILSDSERIQLYLSTCRVGMSMLSLVLGVLGQMTVVRWLVSDYLANGWVIKMAAHGVAATITVLFLVVVQVVPKEIILRSLAQKYTEEMALVVVWPIALAMFVFRPWVFFLHRLSERVLQLLGEEPVIRQVPILSPEEIELLVSESARRGLPEPNEQQLQLLHNVFRVGELTAAKVMVPRTRLVAAPETDPLPDVLQLATTSGHTRIPIYRETIDQVIGVVHLKDLFRLQVETEASWADTQSPPSFPPITSVLHEVSQVPLASNALAVWKTLQQEKRYVAIVVDEFGGTAGMITVADLIEKIFGELRDEFDEGDEDFVIKQCGDRHVLGGEVPIADVNERFKLRLPEDRANTIGGLVMAALGRLPQVGDEARFGQVRLRVEAIDGARVLEVSLYLPPDGAAKEPTGAHH